MSTPYLSVIQVFAFDFAPRGYATCSGQLLLIAQNTALFSLLGTTYGGNGTTTFALPDLRGRYPMNWGQGPGLPNVNLGEVSGEENHTLILSEIPTHSHQAIASNNTATQTYPPNNLWAKGGSDAGFSTSTNNTMSAQAVAIAGGSQGHNNRSPYLTVNYCMTLQGIFPSRN